MFLPGLDLATLWQEYYGQPIQLVFYELFGLSAYSDALSVTRLSRFISSVRGHLNLQEPN